MPGQLPRENQCPWRIDNNSLWNNNIALNQCKQYLGTAQEKKIKNKKRLMIDFIWAEQVTYKWEKKEEENHKRIPIAFPHLSIKLNGTRYWWTESGTESSSLDPFSGSSKLLGSPSTCAVDSRNFSTGSQNCIKLSNPSSAWHFPNSIWSSRPYSGPGDHSSLLLLCWDWNDRGFLLAYQIKQMISKFVRCFNQKQKINLKTESKNHRRLRRESARYRRKFIQLNDQSI